MPMTPLPPTDTRAFFRPVSSALVSLLSGLPAEDWERPTIAGRWLVRDVIAHMTDVALRRVSFHRDRMVPPPPSRPIESARDFVAFINGINAQWTDAMRRCSPRVLTDLFALASRDLAEWFEALPIDAPALFGVSWAGEMTSAGWFDVGREFTELWHHQQQVRLAVGAPSLPDPRYLRAVLDIALRGLPHAFRDRGADPGESLVIVATGASGGVWTLHRDGDRWALHAGEPDSPTTRIRLTDDALWKLLHNALREDEARRGAVGAGRTVLCGAIDRGLRT
jgi:uncharacterized protein (TIGR03083 family)